MQTPTSQTVVTRMKYFYRRMGALSKLTQARYAAHDR